MRPLAEGASVLPAGIEWSDLIWISERVAIIAVVVSIIGILLLRRLAGRSIGFMIAITVGVCTVTTIAGIGVIAWRMIGTGQQRNEILDLMSSGGLASRARASAVQSVGDSGVYVAPKGTLPAELQNLSSELTVTHERLTQARSRE